MLHQKSLYNLQMMQNYRFLRLDKSSPASNDTGTASTDISAVTPAEMLLLEFLLLSVLLLSLMVMSLSFLRRKIQLYIIDFT